MVVLWIVNEWLFFGWNELKAPLFFFLLYALSLTSITLLVTLMLILLQGFIRPGCTMLVLNLISKPSHNKTTASEELIQGLALLLGDPDMSTGRPFAMAATLEALLGPAASISSNRRVVIQAGNQV